jgi:hypothetical protein
VRHGLASKVPSELIAPAPTPEQAAA